MTGSRRRGRDRPGPLVRRAPTRLLRSGVWCVLVTAAFVLLGTAAAAPAMFAEASGNAALASQLAAVPDTAPAGASPVVRLVGGAGTRGAPRLRRALDGIPHLGPGTVTAASVGVETRPRLALFTPTVSAGGRTERARLLGAESAGTSLVPARRFPAPVRSAGAAGVWLPAPVATRLGVRPGDRVDLRVTSGKAARPVKPGATVAVLGVYAVGPDRRTPADAAGRRTWRLRRDALPTDSELRTLPAYLLVTDVATARTLAAQTGDDLLYAAEARLRAGTSLADARETVAGVEAQQGVVRDPLLTDQSRDGLREQVVSGLPALVEEATSVADRTTDWTAPVSAAGVGLGLLCVLAVAVFGLQRRGAEVNHAVGLGLRSGTLGGLAAAEVLGPGLLGTATGAAAAWALVQGVGPGGAVTDASVLAAAGRTAVAFAVAVLVVGAAATLVAATRARLPWSSERRRRVPWELALAVCGGTAGVGLWLRPEQTGPPSPLDLLVPVLLLAAVGAAGARLLLLLPRLPWPARRRELDSAVRRPVVHLAVRRASAAGERSVLLVAVLTTGLGMLSYSVAAAASVRQVTDDRVAVATGASATANIPASYLLDDDAPTAPPTKEGEAPPAGPVPGSRTPPMPRGTTVLWKAQGVVPPEFDSVDVLVVDPATFLTVARWGSGPELAAARELLRAFAAEDARAARRLRAGDRSRPVPAIGVGDVLQHRGDVAAVTAGELGDVPVRFTGVAPVFPAVGELPMVVVGADSFLSALGPQDPRVRPSSNPGTLNRPPPAFYPYVLSAGGVAPLQRLFTDHDIPESLVNMETASAEAQPPEYLAARRSLGYQLAVGVCLALIALLPLALYADRSARRSRPADLMLARMGMGARGPTAARALELAVLTAVAALLAGVGCAALGPLGRTLLDPGGTTAPAFALRFGMGSLMGVLVAAAAGLAAAVAVAAGASWSRAGGAVLRDE